MTPANAGETYLRRALDQIPRSISRLDREPFSKTYGCFDRTFWAWKFVDFPGARYQEGVYPLAFLYAVAEAGHEYHGNPKVLEWTEAAFDYWNRIQHADGSFDEAYPYEHSLAATAFTGFYVAEAFRLVGDAISPLVRDRLFSALRRAGEWLVRNDETHGFLTNHLAAAAATLFHIGQLLGEKRFVHRGEYFIDRILTHQSSEGWYDEYGGADPGYQTHATFYLARCWQLTGNEGLAQSLDRSVQFLAHFVHPDGTLGGEYGSRSTQFYYPAGLEMLATRNVAARWIAERMAESIRIRQVAALETMDAQNFYPLLNNYLFAYQTAMQRGPLPRAEPPPDLSRASVYFPDAGLVRVSRPKYLAIVGCSKGGVLKLFDGGQGRLAYSDCGFVGCLKGGTLIASQVLDRSRRVEVAEDRISIECPFYAFKRTIFQPLTFVAFRLVNLTLGRVPRFAYWIKSLLVKVLIYRRRPVSLSLRRVVLLRHDEIEIRDFLSARSALPLERLRRVDVFSTVHMGSSRYFQPNELNLARGKTASSGDEVPLDRLAAGVELVRIVPVPGR